MYNFIINLKNNITIYDWSKNFSINHGDFDFGGRDFLLLA